MNTQKLRIEIWSDIVCPYCYLGKQKLQQALARLQATDRVELVWRSFQLDPQFPPHTVVPSTQYLVQRKGMPAAVVQNATRQLQEQGKAYGIDFRFDQALTFNTRNAHRLLQWSKTKGRSNELKTEFLRAYFSQGADLSKEATLLQAVERAGLSASEAQAVLQSSQYAAELDSDLQLAQKLGIRGVPFFRIDGQTTISGAQPDAVFEQLIGAALQAKAAEAPVIEGGFCLPDSECK